MELFVARTVELPPHLRSWNSNLLCTTVCQLAMDIVVISTSQANPQLSQEYQVYGRGEGEPHSRRTSPVWDQQVFKRKG
jgi:hypothetical protein